MAVDVKKSTLYDVAKVIATLLVVIAHAAKMYSPEGVYTPANASALMSGLHDFIYAFHMPFFVFLSGCVYGYCIEHGKYQDARKFVLTKAKRLLIPYIAFGVGYVAPAMMLLKITQMNYWNYLLEGIIFSLNSRHLWYLLALFWIFLISVPTRKLPLTGIPRICVVMAVSFFLFLAARFAPPRFQIQNALTYQLYFFFGVAFNELYHLFESVCKVLRSGLFVVSALFLLTMFLIAPNRLLRFAYPFIGIIMMSSLVWCLLHYFPKLTGISCYQLLKNNSFGIFLFHPMIIYVLFHFAHPLDIAPTVMVLTATAVSILLSMLATAAMRKLRFNILIGE